METLRRLLWSMSQSRTFYVLGAGASYGLIPITDKVRDLVEGEYHKVGSYPTGRSARTELFDRVIGDASASRERDFRRLLLENIPPGALDFLTQRAMWRPLENPTPIQYAAFDIVGRPSTLFNFNLDGLASFYCSRNHIVLEPHGRIDRFWFESADYEELLEAAAIYDLAVPHLTPKLLPSPEPSWTTARASYIVARRLFRMAPAMIVTGYSFGRREDGLDDVESFEFFVDLLRLYPRPVFVLSPNPDELTDIFQQRLSSFDVHPVSVRWEVFAKVLVAVSDSKRGLAPQWCDEQLRWLTYAYELAVERKYDV